MEAQNAQAAGESGTVTVLAPLSQDERYRQSTLEQLSGSLSSVAAFLARCEALSMATEGDRLGPIYAAARVLNANAQIAKVLAHVAQVEIRRRTFVEHIQPPDPKNAGLNSGLSSQEADDQARAQLRHEIDRIIKAEQQRCEAQHDAAIACCI